MTNHVPDAVLDSLDSFGEELLGGSPSRVDGRLRQDLRLTILPAADGETAVLRFETEHTQAPPTLRERGSFVTTIVDGVDDRLRVWGVYPPAAYEYTDTVDGTHAYTGTLELP